MNSKVLKTNKFIRFTSLFFLMLGIFLTSTFNVKAAIGQTFSQTFPDANMAKAVADHYRVSVNTIITSDMVQQGKKFDLEDRNISSIVGISTFNKLSYLDLNSNNITQIPTEISALNELSYLYLDNNKITTIPAGALSTMNQLYVLWLNYNELSSVPAEVLSRASLKVLRLGNNNLTSIPNSIGISLSKLRYLGFRDNKVTTVPTSIAGLTKLQTLLISGNSINNFNPTLYNKSILVKEHWNQQYSETLASSRANQPYTFNGLPIYTQLTSYTPQPSITYSLIKPDLSEVVLPSVTISGGQITLPASLLGAAGNYTFKAVINNGDLFPSVYKQNFTLTGIKGVSQSGIPRVGDVLTATLDPTSLVINTTYQWEVSNNGIDGWTNISGATSNTYTIGAYAGKYIRVKASGNGVAGADGLVYSRPTEKIAALGKSVIESVLIQKSGDVLSIASTIPGDAINNITYQWQSSVN